MSSSQPPISLQLFSHQARANSEDFSFVGHASVLPQYSDAEIADRVRRVLSDTGSAPHALRGQLWRLQTFLNYRLAMLPGIPEQDQAQLQQEGLQISRLLLSGHASDLSTAFRRVCSHQLDVVAESFLGQMTQADAIQNDEHFAQMIYQMGDHAFYDNRAPVSRALYQGLMTHARYSREAARRLEGLPTWNWLRNGGVAEFFRDWSFNILIGTATLGPAELLGRTVERGIGRYLLQRGVESGTRRVIGGLSNLAVTSGTLPLFHLGLESIGQGHLQNWTFENYRNGFVRNATTLGLFRGINLSAQRMELGSRAHYAANLGGFVLSDALQNPLTFRLTPQTILHAIQEDLGLRLSLGIANHLSGNRLNRLSQEIERGYQQSSTQSLSFNALFSRGLDRLAEGAYQLFPELAWGMMGAGGIGGGGRHNSPASEVFSTPELRQSWANLNSTSSSLARRGILEFIRIAEKNPDALSLQTVNEVLSVGFRHTSHVVNEEAPQIIFQLRDHPHLLNHETLAILQSVGMSHGEYWARAHSAEAINLISEVHPNLLNHEVINSFIQHGLHHSDQSTVISALRVLGEILARQPYFFSSEIAEWLFNTGIFHPDLRIINSSIELLRSLTGGNYRFASEQLRLEDFLAPFRLERFAELIVDCRLVNLLQNMSFASSQLHGPRIDALLAELSSALLDPSLTETRYREEARPLFVYFWAARLLGPRPERAEGSSLLASISPEAVERVREIFRNAPPRMADQISRLIDIARQPSLRDLLQLLFFEALQYNEAAQNLFREVFRRVHPLISTMELDRLAPRNPNDFRAEDILREAREIIAEEARRLDVE
ncbi:MAG: hypothetical protein JNK65_02845 [Deltaproteobacteria bacterium]|nr:hypothetical protein [Deltaproteobacteria bacterium]